MRTPWDPSQVEFCSYSFDGPVGPDHFEKYFLTMNPLTRTLWLIVIGAFCALLLVPSAHAQTITINEARQKGIDSTVTVEGTVTRPYDDYVRFQDGSGPTGASGLTVRQTSGSFHDDVQADTIRQGTQLLVTGTLSEFNGLLQINDGDLDGYTVEGQGALPDPQEVTLATLRTNGEEYESELVRVTGVDFVGARGAFENDRSYTVTDGSGTATFAEGTLTFRVQPSGETNLAGEPIPAGVFDYTGVVGEFFSQYQLIPVRPADVQPVRSFGFTQQFAQAEEGSGTVEVSVKAFAMDAGDDVSVTAQMRSASTADVSDVVGFDGSQTLDFSGSDPVPKTLSFDPVSDGKGEGVERLEVVLDSDDGDIALPQQFTLWLLDAPAVQTTIAARDSGDVLIDALQQEYGDPRPLGYDIARDSMFAVVYNESNTVEGLYSGYQITVDPTQGDPSVIADDQDVNTEHTWPRSQGAENEPALSNLHILAPTRAAVNSARSNYAFGEIPDADTDTWYFEDQSQSDPPLESDRPLWSELDTSPPDRADRRFEPRHSVKGDVARAAFYFVTVYPNRANFSFFDGQRDTLLDWHEQDPVDATEMRRNLIQAGYQENAVNPFVLDSTLADRAYGSGSDSDGDTDPPTGTFELAADESDLTPTGGSADAQCLVRLSSGTLLFFNSVEGGLYTWDGSSLAVHRAAQELNGDVPDESNEFNRCDGVAAEDGIAYFILRSNQTNDNYVYRTEAADPANNAFEQFNGADGIAVEGSTVYISGIEAFGAPANGIFSISDDLSGSPSEFATNSSVSPGPLDAAGETLYGYSDSFGSGSFNRSLFSLDLTAGSPSFQVFANPFGAGSPLNGGDASNDDVDGIEDVKAVTYEGTEYVVVHNQNSLAPDGEEFGTIRVSDQSISILFTASDLTSNLSVSAYSAAFAQAMTVSPAGEVYAASGGGGPVYIAKVSDAPPLPVELAAFDAVRSGGAVELTWQTASETNNARFEVERKEEGGTWSRIGSVEGGGTIESPQTYRFTDATPPFAAEALTYRLAQVDLDGSTTVSEPVTVRRTVNEVQLLKPFPSPARQQVTVRFAVPERKKITLRVYDVLGRQVEILANGRREGRYEVQLDVSGLSSGIYFLRLQSGEQVRTERLTVVR